MEIWIRREVVRWAGKAEQGELYWLATLYMGGDGTGILVLLASEERGSIAELASVEREGEALAGGGGQHGGGGCDSGVPGRAASLARGEIA